MEKFLNPRKRRRDDLSCELSSLTKRFRDLNVDPDEGGCHSFSGFYNYPINNDCIDAANCNTDCPAGAYNDYNPELGIDLNPVYYEKNKVLYDLHAERVRRHCHCAFHN
ncbi:hypothetical protein KR032_011666 [Drosophila birchii]|nr:hypothetical protein KR032_011666 [Drosophila birchii]